MGGILTKPLTLKELNTELNTALQPIKDQLNEILVPSGDEFASQVTVSVTSENEAGHGLIVCHANQHYLLSAAHLLVLFSEAQTLMVRHEKSSWEFSVAVGRLYLRHDYILKGTEDVGLMAIAPAAGAANVQSWDAIVNARMVQLRLAPPSVGKNVVAHGKVFLRGTVTSLIDDQTRFSVSAHSVGGSSGAPLYNNATELNGVVHGVSKHRGKHSEANGRDDTAVVYCDTIPRHFILVATRAHENLRRAESVPDVLAAHPRNVDEFKHHLGTERAPTILRRLKDDLEGQRRLREGDPDGEPPVRTLDELMHLLDETVWEDGAVSLTDEVQQVLFGAPPVAA